MPAAWRTVGEPSPGSVDHRRRVVQAHRLAHVGPRVEDDGDESAVTAAEIEESLGDAWQRLDELALAGRPGRNATNALDVLVDLVDITPG